MWAKLQKVGGVLMALQGAGHTLVGTPLSYDGITQDAIWFAGAGLAMCFLGLLNAGPWDAAPAWFRRSTIIADGVWLMLMAGLLSTSQSGRVVLAVVLAATCLVGSLGRSIGSSSRAM